MKQDKLLCAECQHFKSLHGPRGCTANCDCKLRNKEKTTNG